MFDDLSPIWFMGIGAVLSAISLFLYLKLRKNLTEFLIPFKKGKGYWCRVIAISDGDTITCRRINLRRSESKIRFAFIDAPESNQSFGKESHAKVKTLVYRKIVKINIVDTDRYGRHVAEVFYRRKNINEELIRTGSAWVYESYIRDKNRLKHLIQLQDNAKKKKQGLWKNTQAIRPSDYRKQSK